MQLTITTVDDRVIGVDLDGNDPIATLKAIIEAETGMPQDQQRLVHNGRDLAEGSTLAAAGVQPNDLIMLLPRAAPRVAAPGGTPGPAGAAAAAAANTHPTAMNPDGSAVHPEQLMQMLAQSQSAALPKELADAVARQDMGALQAELRKLAAARKAAQEEEERFLRLAEEDPFNPEVQRRLEEAIQQKNISENFEFALEHNPEAFSSVCMLYVNMEVNGFPLKAFIDSGAQMTIMSRSCAERCNLLKLMDRRWQGMAVGVGSAKILGRIHMVQMKAGDAFFPVSITVLDQEGMEFLFGLDNLKRHQCCIDLKANCLRFGSSDISLPFLPEHEIPKKDRLDQMEEAAAPHGSAGRMAPPPQQPQQQQQQPAATPAPAAAPPARAPGPTAAAGPGPLPAGWEEKVQRLMALGFPREMCLQVLQATGGNEEVAGSMLFSQF